MNEVTSPLFFSTAKVAFASGIEARQHQLWLVPA